MATDVSHLNTSPSLIPTTDLHPPEWHEQRRLGIGGSEVHHLFPCLNLEDKDDPGSRYGCPRQLSYEKLGIEPDYQHTPETLRIFERGNILEDYCSDRYSETTGKRVFRSNIPYVSKRWPFMRCNIDRRIKADERGVGCFEAKSASEYVFGKMQNEGLPPAYLLQLQHNIASMDAPWGAFGVIESPDYMDAVIEQMEDGRLRRKVIDTLAPKFQFLSFEVARDEAAIEMIVEKETQFWTLVEEGKLAEPLPNIADDRCKTCNYRRTCRGAAYADANAKVPVRDKKTGVQYVQIESQHFAEAAADRIRVMQELNEREELLKAIDNELKQNFPPGVGAVEIPGILKIRWNWQKGASRWDSDALKADSPTISRKVAFADWVEQQQPNLVTEFCKASPNYPSLEDLYKTQGAPTRPFVFSVNGGKE